MGEEVLPTDELLGPEPPQRPEPGERDDARPAVDDSREAIVRIGLNGATGRLDIDDIRFRPKPR